MRDLRGDTIGHKTLVEAKEVETHTMDNVNLLINLISELGYPRKTEDGRHEQGECLAPAREGPEKGQEGKCLHREGK